MVDRRRHWKVGPVSTQEVLRLSTACWLSITLQPPSLPSIRSWLLCNSYPTVRFPLQSLNQPNESLLKNMGLCCLEIMSGSNSFAFSISPFLHNPSIGAFDVVTCRTLIDGLCGTGKIDKAEKLLLTMISGIHEPSYMIYTALIDGLCKKGEIKKAKRLLYKKDGLMLALIPLRWLYKKGEIKVAKELLV